MQRELKRGESLLNHDHTSQTGAASRRGPHSGGYSWRGPLKGSHFYPGTEQIPHNSCHLSGPASGHGLPNEDIVTGDGSPLPLYRVAFQLLLLSLHSPITKTRDFICASSNRLTGTKDFPAFISSKNNPTVLKRHAEGGGYIKSQH